MRSGADIPWAWHAAALSVYAAFAAVFIDHGEPPGRDIAGQGSDPFGFIWFLAWWPYAIGHHLDPLFTRLVWQPVGVHLAWVTSVPLLAILSWPVTQFSPVLGFNLLILLAPVLAALAAWLLCLHLVRDPPAAMIGGFLFGFSSYEIGQDSAVLNLSFVCLLPLLLLLVLLRLQDKLGRGAFILLGGIALICQFLLCIEIFGMIFVFGGIAWMLAMLYLPHRRPMLRRLVADALLAAPPVLLLLSPILVAMARSAGSINLPAAWPYFYTADLANLVIPARSNLFGGWFAPISGRFNGGMQEQDAYLGLPLLFILLRFIRERGAEPAPRLLTALFLLLLLFSLGPRLWIAGHYTGLPLPWTMFLHLPLLHAALPGRFALFVSLCATIMAVLWMAERPWRRHRRMLGLLACLFLLPAWHRWEKNPEAAFFRPGRVAQVLGPRARVLVLPFAINGPSSYWQVENRFGFIQTGGYLGFPPRAMQGFAAVAELFGGYENPGFPDDFRQFCLATRTRFVVLGPGTPARLRRALAGLGWPARQVDDVTLYTVPAI